MLNSFENLDLMLGGQRPYLDKVGLGYGKKYDEASIKNMLKIPKVCHFYFKYGYSSKEYFSTRKANKKKKSKL